MTRSAPAWFLFFLFIATVLFAGRALATSPSVERGRAFVARNCARCHSIDKQAASPLSIAPPFRVLHKRYPVESLEEALAEGITTGHPAMPEFQLETGQVSDVINFLKTLE